MPYLPSALLAFTFSLLGILLSLRYFPKWGIVDRKEDHSIHRKIGVRAGGLSIFVGFLIAISIYYPIDLRFIGVLSAAALVVIVNFIDDAKNISRYWRLFFDIVVALIVIGFGVGIENITKPFGGVIDLSVGTFNFYGIEISPLADFLAMVWIVGVMNVMNWLDGLDGLAGGVAGIASLTLFGLSLLPFVYQPEMALVAITLFGAIMGFLPFNFYDGRIKLGDTGSKFLGFMLAVTAILNQGKVATFFLVLGLPILDAAWVILRRIFVERRSPFKGDTGHFHHRLLRAGFSRRKTVLILWAIAAMFGVLALVLSNATEKLIALVSMTVVLVLFFSWIVKKEV